MELSLYDIIRSPRVTNKAYRLSMNDKKVVLEVHMHANKPMVAHAVEQVFNVKVANVRIMVRKGKNRKTKARTISQAKTVKYAIVTLKPGYDINIFGDVTQAAGTQSASA